MESNAAVLHGFNQPWTVETITVDPPKAGEVLLEWKVAGLCHSDDHVVTGDLVPPEEVWPLMGLEDGFFPVVGGHEGAGVVLEVGDGVTRFAPGDHVSASFVPACGQCRYCSRGQQALCDQGMHAFAKAMPTDGTSRHHLGDRELNLMVNLGTFSQVSVVSDNQIVKVDPDLPFEAVALVSCGVATGWGSATRRANVRPGDTVVVVGIGGIGINAVQGARQAGAERVIAVDPVEFKREKAMELGATHAYESMEAALGPVGEMTLGQMADKVILTPGLLKGELMSLGTKLGGKGSTIVVTAIAPMTQEECSINLFELAMWNKEVKGTIFGSLNPKVDIPALLSMYRSGILKLDELVTNRYTLETINDGYKAMHAGENIRGVVVHDSVSG
jgi:NDMA-dependent alcohol dehydrogenase